MMPKIPEQPTARTTNLKLSQLSKYRPLICISVTVLTFLSKAGHKVVWYSVQQCFRKGCREALRGRHPRSYAWTWWYEVGLIPPKIGFDPAEEIS